MASNRISHFFDLRGPSMTVDTGCSTTLTALHQAVQSLRAGDADMSIVGGSNVMLNPDMFKTMSSLGLLSADGRSFAFDDRANGYGRGEGVATVVLKPLVTAVRDGDTIRAVIRETGLNQDGKTETITSPSQRAQEELIRACYQRAGLDPANTQYFEAHGTGTPTGDPIEARAVAGVFSKGRRHGDRLRIGSVKTNIGHTEPTSGLASVIKVALALEKSLIPPSVNFEQPNRKIDLAEWNLEIPTTLQPWPAGTDGVRRASVNNFGYGGSNAHVIMESYHAGGSRNGADSLSNGHASATNLNGAVNSDHVTNGHDLDAMVNGNANGDTIANGQTKAQTSNHVNGHDSALVLTNGSSKRNVHSEDTPSAFPFRVLLLTAKDEQACQTLATNFAAYLEAKAPSSSSAESVLLDNLVHTLSYRRTVHPWVTTHQFTTLATLVESLRVPRPTRVWSPPRLGMVFTGQGAQWYAMGRELIHAYPVFRASITEAERYLTEFGADYSLMNELLKDADTSRVNETRMSTPLTVSVQISLVRLLRSWGVVPNAVTSHSSGEIAAAYAVGALSYRSAMAVSYFRSGLAGDIGRYVNRKGGMLAVGLGADAAEAYLKRLRNGQVVVACINSPSSITASGDIEGIQELEALVKQDGIFARRVMIDAAYHSHHVEPISKPYLAFLEDMRLGQEDGPELLDETVYYSSPTTGGRMTSVKAIANPQHWVNSMIQPVLFLDSLQDMLTGAETDLVLEVGAHAALSGPVNEVIGLPEFREQGITYASCLVRKQSAVDTMHALVGTLLRKGCPVDLTAVNFPRGIPATVEVLRDLPSYPWNHRIRHWFEPRVNREYRQRKEPPHELLGTVMAGSNPAMPTWRNFVRPSELGWVREHVVQSHMVFPGAGYICMAIEAIRQLNHPASKEIKGYHLKDVDILQALIVPDAPEGIEVQTALRPVSRKDIGSLGWMEFSVSSVTAESQWTEHARGLVSSQVDASQQPSASPVPASYSRRIQPEDIWIGMRSVGIYHGPVFQNIKSIRGGKNRSLTAFSVASTPDGDSFVVHPTTLDSVFQATYTALPGAGGTTLESPKIPRKIKRLWISSSITRQAGHNLLAYTSLTHSNSQSFRASVSLRADNVATPVLELDGLVCQSLGSVPTPPASNAPDRVCAFVEWAPDITFLSKDLLKQQLSFPVDTVETETLTDLRRACIYYMSDALGTLSEQDVARLAEHHRKFHAWMHLQVQLARNGELGLGSEKWLWPEDASVRNEFLEEVEKASINGKMVCHLGPHFVAMLRGEAAPLELMMQDKLLYRYYAEGLKWDRSTHQMAELLRHLVHKNPRARILEVGAGTGGATRHVLKVLGSNSGNGLQAAQYDFTDVSAGFFEEAKKVFAEWEDVLRFRKLDIEVDPSRQGFETGAYDIVIACQVLHATRSMENTMTNVRKLLKPGGKLLMTETTRDQLDLQFVFGLLPGWWLSKEPERNLSPSLTLPFWDRVLDQTGFSGLEFEVHDCESERLYSFSTIMSTAVPSNQPPDAPVSAAEIVIVTGSSSSSPTSRKWLELLQEHISSTTHMPRPDTASLESLLQQGTARGKICVFVGEVDQPILSRLNEAQLQALQALATSCKGLLWLTRGGTLECTRPTMGLAPGFLRSLRHEYVGRDYVLLDLDPGKPSWAVESISCVGEILAEHFTSTNTLQSPGEFEYAERDGVILVPRIHKDHVRNQTVARMSSASTDLSGPTAEESFHQDNRPLQMVVGIPGQLNTLIFRDMAPSKAEADLSPEYIEVKPRAFGVNFRDVMAAMGQLDEQTMGIECSGVVTSVGTTAGSNGFSVGDRVMCTMRGDYASRVRLPWTSATQMPPDMSFELAASVPMAFLTAYISLYNIANLRAGRSVLIHAAAGGVGQAAIALAKHVGAEVFVTAGTEEKREFLEQEHGIPRSHIFSSRDVSFAPALLAATDGRGVDVVLNSLAGQLLQESFNCLAPFGHFVEIGKRDIENNHNLEMQTFARTATFSSVDLLDFAQHRGAELHRALVDIVQLIARNKVQPISPVTTYPLAEIEKAFRLLQAGKHMGKVVLSASEADTVPVSCPLKEIRAAILTKVISGWPTRAQGKTTA
ncbi:Type I Iterative Polyketide synthase (PKS) [Coniochaeta pulveracea]|uniref:Type I Iterative Polyketide synthase (PKS) n=1 Tax=Coniochaeta pulveracea TaxID=177199 RepID=A0A420YF71_9PEZI|nr:Type I Iterative Polyketide synthase (PKS) [Coniochaeta pulveracea]